MNKEYEFKVGDIVITKSGFTNSDNHGDEPTNGGSGYAENLKFTITSISRSCTGKPKAWGAGGVYISKH